MLENVHPQLPATFFHLFVGAVNRWTRIYDYRDAEERVETLREWAAQEPDAGEYEIPDVAGSIPPCMRQVVLENSELEHVKDKINDSSARKLVDAVIALDHLSAQAERSELDETLANSSRIAIHPCPVYWLCLLKVTQLRFVR